MGDGMPRDENGLRPCEWCAGPIRQPATGRRRRYCSRTHRELAYRERKTQRRIGEALQADAPPPVHICPFPVKCLICRAPRPVPTVDETRSNRVPSVDETRRSRAGRRRAGMTVSAMPLFQAAEE